MSPCQALLLARLSSADWIVVDGRKVLDPNGVNAQIEELLDYAETLGWGVGPAATHHIIENDTSAYKVAMVSQLDHRGREVHDADGVLIRERRPKRPEYWRALRMLRSGQADGVLFVDQDRGVGRHPRDLEDAIDVAELHGIPFRSITSEDLNLNTSSGRSAARRKVAHDSESSADTSRRTARARKRHALAGLKTGGPRRFGWKPGNQELNSWEWPGLDEPPEPGSPEWMQGRAVPGSEAAEIRSAGDQVLAGVSLRQIVADLRKRGVPTSHKPDAKWEPATMRRILMHPAIMGRLVYRPTHPAGTPRTAKVTTYTREQIKGPAPWPPIFTEDEFWAIRGILEDPSRRTGAGNTPKHLLSLIARCWRCNDGNKVRTYMGELCYYCNSCGHGSRIPVDLADTWVTRRIIARLERPDASDLLPRPAANVDTTPLEKERETLRTTKASQVRMHAQGLIDDEDLAEGLAVIRERLEAITVQLTSIRETSPLDGIAGREDAAEVWARMSLGLKRSVLREIAVITMGPTDKKLARPLAVMEAVQVVIRG